MYILILTTLLMIDSNLQVKQTKIETFATVMECSMYKKKIEAKLVNKSKTDAVFLDCRREV